MNTKAIRQLADVTLDKYRSSIPRKAFEEFVKDIITGENRATAFRYEASPICRASFPSTLDEALKPVINAVLSALKKLWKVSAKAIGVPPKWLHLAAHAKKARTRKKYRNRIRRYVFEALAAEGGGGP